MTQKKILIGLKSWYDDQLIDCLHSLKLLHDDFDIFTIIDEKQPFAYQKTFSTFNAHQQYYRGFCVLDGDMEFINPDSLQMIQEQFNQNYGEINCALDDYLTQTQIFGMRFYESSGFFLDHDDSLIPDKAPYMEERKTSIIDNLLLARHMYNPSHQQSYRYGLQRALKTIQPDRQSKNFSSVFVEFNIVFHVWLAYQHQPNIDRLLCLAGFIDTLYFDKEQMEIYLTHYADSAMNINITKHLADKDTAHEYIVKHFDNTYFMFNLIEKHAYHLQCIQTSYIGLDSAPKISPAKYGVATIYHKNDIDHIIESLPEYYHKKRPQQ